MNLGYNESIKIALTWRFTIIVLSLHRIYNIYMLQIQCISHSNKIFHLMLLVSQYVEKKL